MSKQTSVVDEMFGDSELDSEKIAEWEKRNEENKKKGGSGLKFVPAFFLKPGSVSVVSFLTRTGMMLQMHRTDDPSKKMRHGTILCKAQQCEACKAGDKVSDVAVFPVIDWLHSYEKNGKKVKRPQFKLFQCGQTSAAMIDKMRGKLGNSEEVDGRQMQVLTGKLWEISRAGSGSQTVYNITPEKDHVPDFKKMVTIETKDGTMEIPNILTPDGWPEYEESGTSFYCLKQLKPDQEMDWSNPMMVKKWVQLHYLNTPLEEYLNHVARIKGGKSASSSSSSESSSSKSYNDDDIPI